MSSKVKKMSESIQPQEQQKTKSMTVQINVNISGYGAMSTYMIITGIPEDLPKEFEETVITTAKSQFANYLNGNKNFIEFYTEGKSNKDEEPQFINVSKLDWIQVKSIKKFE